MAGEAGTPYEIGATVYARDGEVGPLDAVVAGTDSNEPAYLVVRSADRHVEIPLSLVNAAASDREEIRLTVDRATLARLSQVDDRATQAADDRVVVPVHEETLVPGTRDVQRGAAVVHKRVEAVPYETAVDLAREDVTVERVPVNRPVTTAPEPYYEGDTLVVPVVEEVLVTEKRLMLREEVRITRRRTTEQVPVRDTLRREVVEVEGTGDIEIARPGHPPAADAGSAAPEEQRPPS